MDKIVKWDDLIKDFNETQEVKDFIQSMQESVLDEKEFFKSHLADIVDINKVKKVLFNFLNFLVSKINAQGVIAYYLNEKKGDLFFTPYYVLTPPENNKAIPALLSLDIHFDHVDNFLSYVLSQKKIMYVKEVDPVFIASKSGKELYDNLPICSHITIPLFLDQSPVGVIQFYSLSQAIELNDLQLIDLQENTFSIAMILKSILLYEKIYRNYNTIKKINTNIKKELKLAQKIQENLMPKTPPKLQGVQVEFWYKPMEELGGDFFDFILRREEDGIGIFISDVAGHGVPSALITTMIKGVLANQRAFLDRPKQMMQRMNTALLENNVSDFFVTAFYLYLNLKNKTMGFTSAGHNEAFVFKKRTEEVIPLKTKGKFLGIFEENSWKEEVFVIEKGDRIVLYTDGITEMLNNKGEEFGFEQLVNLIKLSKNLDLISTKKFIINNLLSFENTEFVNDDKAFILADIV